ncbi:MAG TPA: hypothetical protein VFB99_13790, partial [Vicinamibacterales bacterium]|nr:hypothetical protein [Vicinamibacterales bacterium]
GRWGLSLPELERVALEKAHAGGRLDPYPSRREAARICLDGGLRADAVQRILEEAFDYPKDPPILLWIRLMLLEADQLNTRSPERARKETA